MNGVSEMKAGAVTRDELLQMHEDLCERGRDLMIRKNQDYGANEDPFRNFRFAGLMGFPVRMGDKVARLMTFAERGSLMVKDESVEDTAIDLINYSVLLLGYIEDCRRRGLK